MDTGIKPKVRLQYFFFGVGGSSLFWPDPDETFEKNPDTDPTYI
jgi:hypothetical protein